MVLPALLRLAALTAGRSAFPRNALSSSTTFALFCSLSPLEQLRPATESGQTVYALSSGAGVRAGVSVIRVSGPDARLVLERMCPGNGKHVVPQPRRAVLRSLRWPAAAGSEGEEGGHGKSAEGAGARQPGELIDKALVLWFEGPNSFTGEDTVELHTHGSPAVVSATLEGLSMLPGLRLAEPGEFTRQAYNNNRMDLAEVEGLGDLINADTEAQRKQALAAMGGYQRRKLDGWRDRMTKALAYTEALIDFGEDAEDVTDSALASAVQQMRAVRHEIEAEIADGQRGETVRDGVRVAILGPPNAGKSSLLNLLSQRDAAIVSPVEGTTRDVVTVSLQLGGLPVILSDTAGLRSGSTDPIERMGMIRSAAEAAKAHVQLWVYDAAESVPLVLDVAAVVAEGLGEDESSQVAAVYAESGAETENRHTPLQLLLLNKIDLVDNSQEEVVASAVPMNQQWRISCSTSAGIAPFLDALGRRVRELYGSDSGEAPLITRARHRQHLEQCTLALKSFEQLATLGDAAPLDLACEELRAASTELGRITGRVDVEELLDVIFRDFCIGK